MRFVPSRMLRTRLSWLVIGGVAVILIAAAVDSFRSSEPKAPSAEGRLEGGRQTRSIEEVPVTAVAETETGPLERCTAQQLALQVERLGGGPVLALAHVWGKPCRTPRIRIELSLFDRKGEPVQAYTDIQQSFAPTSLSPNVEVIAGFQVTYLCGGQTPRRFVAEARPYVVRGWLPRGYGGCLDDLGP
jgi:hypothetical protein